jgi:hydroxymethylpyrimidine kinase/phosphomethylpyrimidine kinase
MLQNEPAVLTIAGLDPSGGAGVIADIRTLMEFGCLPTAVLTSITFQNTLGVFGAVHQSAATVRSQVEPLLRELNVAAVKTGMLPTAEIVVEVARLVRETNLPAPVVDPVMNSTSGAKLISDDAFLALENELLPLARVVTPNIPEAERLAGFRISNTSDMHRAAQAIRGLGIRAVIIKGGHLQEQKKRAEAIDILDNDGVVTIFRSVRIDLAGVRGTGCTLSAGIAACLAKGMSLEDAVRAAKQYVTEIIRRRADVV